MARRLLAHGIGSPVAFCYRYPLKFRTGLPMHHFPARHISRRLLAPALATLLLFAHPALSADDPDAPKGAAVTVLKAAKTCFANIVEASGIVMPREETAVRSERQGLKVAEVLADPGDTVS